jgi:MFS family permease
MTAIQTSIGGGLHAPGFWDRQLTAYPGQTARRLYLLLVILITMVMYYQLFVAGVVLPLLLPALKIPFKIYVYISAVGSVAGAIASLVAGLGDRVGRIKLVVIGQICTGLIVLFGVPNAVGPISYGCAIAAVAFTEGLVLVSTPVLVRDFSPQMSRGTAMGFWTLGPVLGTAVTTAITAWTLPIFHTWQSQFRIAGALGLITAVVALLFLRELSPTLRNQRIVHEQDKHLVELKSKMGHLDTTHKHSGWQMLRANIIVPAMGIGSLLLFYGVMTGFATLYLTTTFHYSVHEASVMLTWGWVANGVALVVGGMFSDWLGVRKPVMLVGALVHAALILVWIQFLHAQSVPSQAVFTLTICGLLFSCGIAFGLALTSMTETIEFNNPALMATGMAIYGWFVRVVSLASLLTLPLVVTAVDELLGARAVTAAHQKALAANVPPSADLVAAMDRVKQAIETAPGQWQTWYFVCLGGVVFFMLTVFLYHGRWSPAAAKKDLEDHHAKTAKELAQLRAQHANSSAPA